jgi:hypothetical protein
LRYLGGELSWLGVWVGVVLIAVRCVATYICTHPARVRGSRLVSSWLVRLVGGYYSSVGGVKGVNVCVVCVCVVWCAARRPSEQGNDTTPELKWFFGGFKF